MTDRPDRPDERDPNGPDRPDRPDGRADDSTAPDPVADRLADTVDEADLDETVARVRSDLDGTATRVKDALAAGDPRVVAAGALGFDGLAYAASRYAPEYLGVLGGSPLVVGLFGTVAMAVAAVASGVDLGTDGRSVAPVLAAVAGLVTWLLAPGLAAATGVRGFKRSVLAAVAAGMVSTVTGVSVAYAYGVAAGGTIVLVAIAVLMGISAFVLVIGG